MVNEDELSAVLSEFAWTLATDFPIQAILDHLVARIVDVLPITAAGVTLISAGQAPRYVAASDASALRYEALQTELGQGPCLTAFNTGTPVAVPDLRSDDRYPVFGPAATAAGLAAVFTFPLRHGDGRFGALDLYSSTPGALSPRAMDVAQTLAHVAAAYLLNAQARDDARLSAEHYQRMALHDGLTGLPNRLLLQERLEHAAKRARRTRSNCAVLFVDLDKFKQVNDAYGHQVGDELLRAVAERLNGLVRLGDTLARVSGDEFVFLCEDLSCTADAALIARRVEGAFREPFLPNGLEIRLAASVGMAFAGPTELISDQLVAQADMAMYQAKRKGVPRYPALQGHATETSTPEAFLRADLVSALAEDRLAVAYQPIVRAADGGVTGVEALLRWNHPVLGPIPAATLARLAEDGGLSAELGAWVLERACHDRARWSSTRPGPPLDVAVNVSVQQLLDPGFGLTLTGVLAATGTDPGALVLEVAEDILVDDADTTLEALRRLKDLGIRIALDDFGSGFSSLSYLSRMPVDIVKIDRAFIGDIGRVQPGNAIATAVTNLSHALGLSVVAEGVQTRAQSEGVRAIGCELAQGDFYAGPMPAAEIAVLATVLADS